MTRLIGLGVATLLTLCVLSVDLIAEGRWKIGGNGCYWDQYDSGPSQCGRWKVGGDSGCYWDSADSGPDQCSAPASESSLPNLINTSDELSSVGSDTLAEAEAALNIAYSHGLVDSPPGDLSEAAFYYQNPNHEIPCAKKQEIYQQLNRCMLATGVASGVLGAGAAASAFFFPPASIGIGIAAAGMATLSVTVSYAMNSISNMQCTP